MRRQVGALLALGLVAASLATPAPFVAANDSSFTTNVSVGASRTLPSGSFASYAGCRVGYNGTTEYRCAFEFGISIPSTAKILSASLSITKIGGFCGLGCPVDVFAYHGNGSGDLAD